MSLFFSLVSVFVIISAIKCSLFDSGVEHEEAFEKELYFRSGGEITYTLQDTALDFEIDVVFDTAGHNLSSSELDSIGDYLITRFSSNNFSSMSNVEVFFYYDSIISPNEIVTVLGFGTSQSVTEMPVAFEFHGNGDGSGGVLAIRPGNGGVEHTCTGDPCNCCDFIYQTYIKSWTRLKTGKKIIGCKCLEKPQACFTIDGNCNHSKTSK